MPRLIDVWRAVDSEARLVAGEPAVTDVLLRGVSRTRAAPPHLPPASDGHLLIVDGALLAHLPADRLIAEIAASGTVPAGLLIAAAPTDALGRWPDGAPPTLASQRSVSALAVAASAYLADEAGFLDRFATEPPPRGGRGRPRRSRARGAGGHGRRPAAPRRGGRGRRRARRPPPAAGRPSTGRTLRGRLLAPVRHAEHPRGGLPTAPRRAVDPRAAHPARSGGLALRRPAHGPHRRGRGRGAGHHPPRPPPATAGAVAAGRAADHRAPRRPAAPAQSAGSRVASEPLDATLLAVARANGRVAPAARSLGVHRNTVLYRLRIARDRRGIDPRRPEDALRLLREAESDPGRSA